MREAVWREGGKGAGGRQDGELELGPHKDESQKDSRLGDGGLDHPKCKASWLLMHPQVAAAKIPLSPPVCGVHNEETVSAGQGLCLSDH